MHDQVLAVLAESCPSLTSLNLAQCGSISSLGVERLAQGCKGLALLNLSYCEKVTDTAILHLAGHCNQLEELILTNLEVGSPAINSLLSRCGTRLSNLSLSGTLIDGSSVEYLLGFCSILRDLDLSFCHQIPFENIKDLVKRAGSLRKVTLWGHFLSSEQTQSLFTLNPLLVIERFAFSSAETHRKPANESSNVLGARRLP